MPAPKAAFVWLGSLSATLFRIVTFSCSSFNVAAHNSPSVVGNDPLLTGGLHQSEQQLDHIRSKKTDQPHEWVAIAPEVKY
jgi:hypothetical protein